MSEAAAAPKRELRLVCGVGARGPDRLDRLSGPSAPSLEAILGAYAGAPASGAVTLWGGEPTTRADLPALLTALRDQGAPRLGLQSDGLALTKPGALAMLKAAGLTRARIELHAMSGDGGFEAHDWLVMCPGAGRRAALAIKACRAAGLETEAEITLTRPTTSLLVDTVRGLIALGAQRLRVRRLTRRGAAAGDFVALSPRLALAEPELVAAASVAARQRVPLTFHGFPACALGEASGQLVLAAEEPLLAPEGALLEAAMAHVVPGGLGCGGCLSRRCDGAPGDYVARFGWAEVRSEDPEDEDEDDRGAAHSGDAPADPPPRAGHFPATRLSAAIAAVRADPVLAAQAPLPRRMALRLTHPFVHACPICSGPPGQAPVSSRVFRQHMVSLRSQGATELEILGPGALHHPELVELLRDAVVLGFEAVQVSGDGRELAARPRRELSRLRRLRAEDRLTLTLHGPDAQTHDAEVGVVGAFANTLAALAQLEERTRAQVGLCAVLHRAEALPRFAEAWDRGALPGEPGYRLALLPGEREALPSLLASLPEASKAAIAPLLSEAPPNAGWQRTARLFDPSAPRCVGATPTLGDHATTA